jgi:hypothetical protein
MYVQKDKAYKAYFEAMKAGWAGNNKPTEVPDRPGWVETRYTHEDIEVRDSFLRPSAAHRSSGFTTMSLGSRPFWIMQYGGWYEIEVIPFLKTCLMSVYSVDEFLGGRGPLQRKSDGLVYTNHLTRNSYQEFEGWEEIRRDDTPRTQFGMHWYRGMLLTK